MLKFPYTTNSNSTILTTTTDIFILQTAATITDLYKCLYMYSP